MVFSRWTHTPPVSKKEEFHMKQTTLTQRLAAALVALCMVLSVWRTGTGGRAGWRLDFGKR